MSMRRHWEAKYPPPRSEDTWKEYAKTVTMSVEKWLDQGSGACHFKKGCSLVLMGDQLVRLTAIPFNE